MYPDFLCIGAQKAGTSWLYENLRRHPMVWLTPMKEIHYFDYPQLTFRDLVRSLAGYESWHRRTALRKLVSGPAQPIREAARDKAILLRYLFGTRNDLWYQSLFGGAEGRMTGDITPAYARLDDAAVAAVHERMPDAKIIYLLRNPIDRSWSQAGMHFARPDQGRRKAAQVAEDELLAFLRSESCLRNSDYLANLARWERFYPRERIFVGFLDEIADSPEQFLLRLFAFLGLPDSVEFVPQKAVERVFSGERHAMPAPISRVLTEYYWPALVQLDERFGNRYTQAWLRQAEQQRAEPMASAASAEDFGYVRACG